METLTDKRFDSPRALFMQLVADGIISKADLGDLPVTRHIIPEYELIREFAEWYKSNHTHGIDWSEKRDGYGGVQTDYCLTYDHAKQFFEYRKDRIRQAQALFNTASGQPQRLTIPETLLNALQQAGFIENITACPLNWKGTIKELNYFINKYFPNVPAKWKKTVNTFVWNCTAISENSLKTAIDKYDNPPERAEIIDNLS